MDLVEFEWSKCVDGYELIDVDWASEDQKEKKYLARMIVRKSRRTCRFRLLDPEAFAKFANAEPSETGMIEFCNRFGQPDLQGGFTSVAWLIEQQKALKTAWQSLESDNPSELIVALDLNRAGACDLRLRTTASGELELVFVPQTLLQALWTQLAFYAVSETQIFRCKHCGDPFRTGHQTGRRNTREYCGDSCRLAASRARTQKRRPRLVSPMAAE